MPKPVVPDVLSTDGAPLAVGQEVYFIHRRESWRDEKARVKSGVVIQVWHRSRTVRVRFDDRTERKWTPELAEYEGMARRPWRGCFAKCAEASKAARAMDRDRMKELRKDVAKAKRAVAEFRQVLARP